MEDGDPITKTKSSAASETFRKQRTGIETLGVVYDQKVRQLAEPRPRRREHTRKPHEHGTEQ